jgi:hypothetical protein
MLSISHSVFFSGIWCTPMVSSLCVKKCPQSHITWIGVSSSSPQSLQDISLSGGFLLWFTMADCLRRNANPVRNLTIRPTVVRACFNNWSLFGRLQVGYQTLVCQWPSVDCHLLVHLEIMSSLSSFLIVLLAVSPEPSTIVEFPPAFASWSASSLPRMPTWALTHSRTTVSFLPSWFRVSLVSLVSD